MEQSSVAPDSGDRAKHEMLDADFGGDLSHIRSLLALSINRDAVYRVNGLNRWRETAFFQEVPLNERRTPVGKRLRAVTLGTARQRVDIEVTELAG